MSFFSFFSYHSCFFILICSYLCIHLNTTIAHTFTHSNIQTMKCFFVVIKIHLSHTINMAIICIESVLLNKPLVQIPAFHLLSFPRVFYFYLAKYLSFFLLVLFCIESYNLWHKTYDIWHMTIYIKYNIVLHFTYARIYVLTC